MTKESAGVELTMPDGKVFPGKMKETDQKIIEIIGMDMNQFSQVSMISQGDFMKLLLASSKERKEIFSQIFPTKIYWQIQNSLAEQEKSCTVNWKMCVKSVSMKSKMSSVFRKVHIRRSGRKREVFRISIIAF